MRKGNKSFSFLTLNKKYIMITKEVMERLTSDTKDLFDFYDEKRLSKSKKQKSEDISGLLETAMEDLIDGAIAPKVDSEPDIRLNGSPVEIKTTADYKPATWRGGGLSKREGHFIFVTWNADENNNPSFFLAGIDLVQSDWNKGSDNYYAKTYGKKELYSNNDKVTFYHGSLEGYARGKQTCIRVHLSEI